jgi:hypothetical protein
MSVDQLPPGKARPAKPAAQFVRYDEYIDKQIESTRRTVKAVDLLTALLTMAVGTLAFLFVAATIEHWLVPGGFGLPVRLVLFVALVLSLTFYTTRKLWPLVRGSINPAYAAQAIEHDNPSLKNSLLNLLLFRQHRDDVTDAVYETLEAEAAKRLTRVPIDSAVDRTQLLRLGYALIAILAVVALYKILSPKDPFASAERLLMPWARIAAPSRVSINNIEPGHVTLARGETLQVAADVRGISEDDPVVVRFTTADGQAVDRPAPMKPNSAGLRFSGQIPPETDASLGVAQDLRYHVEAGDARSLEYKVTVVSAPTIVIERIDYDFPAYTGYEDRGVDRLGDIRAIEGTRVTIHARANQPIDEAAVDFEADGRRDIALTTDNDRGQASFALELRDDRQTPKFTSYALRFTGRDGRPNRDPVKFRIDVLADYPPEASILSPAEKTRDVRLDETISIEVEARDPDFALGEVRLQGESAGHSVVNELLSKQDHIGRFTGRFLFTPDEHGLHAGDIVRYWVTVRDNRTPRANETTTDSQTLRIVGPDANRPPQDRIAQRDERVQRDRREPQNNDQNEQLQEQQGEGQSGQSEGQSQDGESSDASQAGEQGESASADGESGQNNELGDANQSNENGAGEQSHDQSGDAQPGVRSSGDGQSSAGEQAGESGDAQQQPGGTEQIGEGERGGERQGARDGSQSDSSSETGSGERRAEDGNREQDSGSSHGGEDAPARDASDSTPVSSEGDNDADAFERIRDFLKRKGQLPEESKPGDSQSNKHDSQPGESASADGQQGATEHSNDKSSPGDRSTDAQATDDQRNSREPTDQGQEGQQQPDGGQPTQGQGESGAGNQSETGKGSPESQDLQSNEKWQQRPSENQQEQPDDPASGGHGKTQSDSQGDQGGDHSGGGEQGGGQQSNHDGTGSSGQNQSADEGAGESSEQGAGRNSMSGGQDAQADDRTGESSENQAGEGSQQREGTGDQEGGSESGQQQSGEGESQRGGEDQQPSDKQSKQQQGEQGDQQELPSSGGGDGKSDAQRGGEDAPARDQESQQSQGSPSSGANSADGAGKVPDGAIPPSGATGEAPAGDAANLEYAREQTDLVLESLAEQMKRQKVDQRLLDELGWTEADMQRFVERWQQLKAAAGENGPAANETQRELDDALRSLGLRPDKLQQSKVTDDQNRNLRQGYRGAIPLEYKERLKAYEQGVSRARQSDE